MSPKVTAIDMIVIFVFAHLFYWAGVMLLIGGFTGGLLVWVVWMIWIKFENWRVRNVKFTRR